MVLTQMTPIFMAPMKAIGNWMMLGSMIARRSPFFRPTTFYK